MPTDQFNGPMTQAERARVVGRREGVAAERARILDVDRLAQIIRTVDGDHTLGAGALAEAIVSHLTEGATDAE